MTCKDCINYDVCSTQSVNCDRANHCSMFKNKSQYIKFPCKVGDTVYFLDTKHVKQGRKKVPVEYVAVGFVDNIVFGSLGVPIVNVCDKNNICTTFDGSKDFGKIIFLDKKSAEKALRECENK